MKTLRNILIVITGVLPFLLFAASANAEGPPVEIFLSEGYGRFGDAEFDILGGKTTHPTPVGRFTVRAKHEKFYSNKYKAPMPLSIFFTQQCAIHVGSLRTRSHGCIHVDWEAAEYLWYYTKVGKTKVIVYR